MHHHRRKKIRLLGRDVHLPQSRFARVGIGIGLVGLGFLGFLPVLGFWMVPLGLLVLSIDLPIVRRWRRRLEVWLIPWWRSAVARWRGEPPPKPRGRG